MENQTSETGIKYCSVVVRPAFQNGDILKGLLTAPQIPNGAYAALVREAVKTAGPGENLIDEDPKPIVVEPPLHSEESGLEVDAEWFDQALDELCRDEENRERRHEEIRENRDEEIRESGELEVERHLEHPESFIIGGARKRWLAREASPTPRSKFIQTFSDFPSIGSPLDVGDVLNRGKNGNSPTSSLAYTQSSIFSQPEDKMIMQQRTELVGRLKREYEECRCHMNVFDGEAQRAEEHLRELDKERQGVKENLMEIEKHRRDMAKEMRRKALKLKALRS